MNSDKRMTPRVRTTTATFTHRDFSRCRDTYRIDGGDFVTVSIQDIEQHGLVAAMALAGVTYVDRRDVYQGGKFLGTVPGDFRPHRLRPQSPCKRPRPDDFTLKEDHWVIDESLSLEDLESIPGFRWENPFEPNEY